MLTIEYTFKTPELQQNQEKKDIQDKRLDLEHLAKRLPGTPIGILYINDDDYRLL